MNKPFNEKPDHTLYIDDISDAYTMHYFQKGAAHTLIMQNLAADL